MGISGNQALSPRPTNNRSIDIIGLIKLGRPIQWTKNLVVFAALVFSGKISSLEPAIEAVTAFFAFCLLSSAVYAINDILDVEEDRVHPTKKRRPIASGRVSIPVAFGYAVGLMAGSLTLGWSITPWVGVICIAYGVINLAYSRWLKHVVILDVMLVSSGFVLRAVAGAAAVFVTVSPWLLLCTILLALFLAMCKRRSELAALATKAGESRRVLKDYTLPFLDQMISSTTAAVIMAYCMYAFTSPTAKSSPYLMLTVPYVIYGIFRYLHLVYSKGIGSEPERILISDHPLQLDILLWGITSGTILYLA